MFNRSLNKRFEKLVKKLGIVEYQSLGDFEYWDIKDSDSGILHKISFNKDKQIELLRKDFEALTDYLGVDIKDVKAGRVAVKRKKVSKK